MNLKDKYNGIRQEVKGLMDAHPDGMPTDVANKVTSLLEQADGLKAQIDLEDRAGGMEDYTQPAGSVARSAWNIGGNGNDEQIDTKSYREVQYAVVNKNGVLEQKTHRWFVPTRIDNKEYKFALEAYMVGGEARMSDRELKTLREGFDSDGGYLVSADMQERVVQRMAAMATIRQYATIVNTTRDSVIIPRVLGNSDIYGTEMRGTFGGENPASNAVLTNQTFGQVNIPVNTLMAEVRVSMNLLEDTGFDLGGYIGNQLGETFATLEDEMFMVGTGANGPRGMLLDVDTTNGITSVATGASSTLTADGMLDLYGALPPQYETKAVWVMSKATEAAVRKLQDGVGSYAWAGGFSAIPSDLLGFQVVRNQWAPAVAANAYPIVFGDLSGYVIADRVGISVQRLVEKYADQNIVGFIARKRVGGRLAEPYRLRVAKVSV